MVVVVITAIASMVAIPAFVGSFRGAKLKTGTRTVLMASRLARSTAVLQNQHMALLFFPDHGEVEMVRLETKMGRDEQSMFLENRGQRRVETLLEPGAAPQTEEAPATPPAMTPEMVRQLPEGVRIVGLAIGAEKSVKEDATWVSFYPNGMSDRFAVTLEDETGRQAVVEVDPISGKVKITYV